MIHVHYIYIVISSHFLVHTSSVPSTTTLSSLPIPSPSPSVFDSLSYNAYMVNVRNNKFMHQSYFYIFLFHDYATFGIILLNPSFDRNTVDTLYFAIQAVTV